MELPVIPLARKDPEGSPAVRRTDDKCNFVETLETYLSVGARINGRVTDSYAELHAPSIVPAIGTNTHVPTPNAALLRLPKSDWSQGMRQDTGDYSFCAKFTDQ